MVLASFVWLAVSVGYANESELAQAWKLARENEMDAAKRQFRAVELNSKSNEEDRIQALYGQAYCWNYASKGGDIGQAAALYRRVIETAPAGHPLIAWSDFESVESSYLGIPYEKRDYPAIAASFMDVYRRHPQSPAGEQAYLVSLNFSKIAATPDWPDFIKQCAAFIRDNPASPWVPRVVSLMGEGYQKMGDIPRQLECMIQSLKLMQQGGDSLRHDYSTSMWNIAYISEYQLGDFELARNYYQQLIKNYPRDNRVFLSEKALRRMELVEKSLRQDGRFPPELGEAVQK